MANEIKLDGKEKQFVLVEYFGTGAHIIGVQKELKAGELPVIETAARLLPGINEIPLENWDKVKNNEVVVKALNLEKIKILKTLKASEHYLKDMPVEKALLTIGKTARLELLEKWEKVETNNSLKQAIEKQIEEIKKPLSMLKGNSK